FRSSISVPRPTAEIGGIAEWESRASIDIDLFQLSLGSESNGSAIRRPEGESGALRSLQRLSDQSIQRANPQQDLARFVPGSERDLTAVRRNTSGIKVGEISGPRIEVRLVWTGNDKTHDF